MRSLRHKLTHSTLHACLKGGFALVAFIGMAGQAIAQIHSAPLGTPTEVMVAEPSAAASSATDATAEITITGGQVSESGANLFHEFEQFNIETGQTASFVTAPEIQNVLSLITGGPSTIDGLLQVLGSQADLYLINPAGILFGPNVQLNLPGNFTANTATSLEFDDQWLNFMTAEAVDYSAFSGTPSAYDFSYSGAVINTGALTLSAGQSLSLMGSTVVNTGTIFAPGGNITLTAIEGDQVVRLNPGNQLLSLEVSTQSLSHNGPIPQTLSELLTGTSADIDTLTTHADGTVSLSSTGSILPENTGTAVVSGSVSTMDDTGGTINVFGSQVALLEAQLSSTGDFGGGRLRLGGDAQGSLLAPTARRTYVGPNSVVSADARDRGNGGQIYIWSEDATDFYGALSAQGGRSSGDGGFAEISGKHNLAYGGSVDLSAPQGALGTLLFDPKTITILSGDGTNAPVFPRLPDLLNSPSNGSESFTIYERTLERLSPDANITLQATIDIMIDSLEDGVLSLQPGSNLIIQSDINDNGTGIFKMNSSDTIAAPDGSVTITSGEDSRTTVVGNIDLSGEGGEGGEGSQIFIDDASGISVGRLNAGEDGLIQLTSNNIEFSAGQNSILASKVELSSATTAAGTGDIYFGSDVAHPDAYFHPQERYPAVLSHPV
ncbi:MAG: filamentous hemagglutinin N-terminal domain-containing protein, partial [Cyanobacteria bacterium J06560_2]